MKMQRFCVAGHDKDGPYGSYWSWRNYKGKRVQVRQCAWCARIRDRQSSAREFGRGLHPNSMMARFIGRPSEIRKKGFCVQGHNLDIKGNAYLTKRIGKQGQELVQRVCRICSLAREEKRRRALGIPERKCPTVMPRFNPEPADILPTLLDRFLAMPPRKVHQISPFARRA